MFKSCAFPIENRQGLEDANERKLLTQLVNNFALDISNDNGDSSKIEPHKREAFLNWLSDWHLVFYVGALGLFSEVYLDLLSDITC